MYKEKTVLKVCQKKNKIFIYMSDLINYYLFFRNSHFRFSTTFSSRAAIRYYKKRTTNN